MYDNWLDRLMQSSFWAWPALLVAAIFLAGTAFGVFLGWWWFA